MSEPSSTSADPAQWEGWYATHAPALLLYARQWCRHQADAEDALQEGFVGFWRQRSQAHDAKAYLFRCVRNAALARVRRDTRRRRREAEVAWLFLSSPAHPPVAVGPVETVPVEVLLVPDAAAGPEAFSFEAYRRAAAGSEGALMELIDASSGTRSGRSEPALSFSSWSELLQKDPL